MRDPKLKTTRVDIKYSATDGYRSEVGFSSQMSPKDPQSALIGAIDELARITALFGFEDEAMLAFLAARERVAEWRRLRGEK